MKQIFTKYMLLAAMLSLGTLSAQAVEFKGMVSMGYDVGGDTLVTVNYTDGSTYDVTANSGLVFNGGVVMVTGDFETQATVGYKFDSSKEATNVNVNFNVLPIELIGFYRTDNVRMGVGLSYHVGPTLEIDYPGDPAHGTYKFKDAIGYVAQIGWAPRTGIFSIDLRFTTVDFEPSNFTGSKKAFSGNVTGLYGSLYF
jgi:hypothetical protein